MLPNDPQAAPANRSRIESAKEVRQWPQHNQVSESNICYQIESSRPTRKDEEMRRADPSLITVNRRISRTIFVALVVGAIALLSLGTRPAETQETSAQPLSYKVQDLGTLRGTCERGRGHQRRRQGGRRIVYERRRRLEQHAFLYSGGQMSDLGTLGGSLAAMPTTSTTPARWSGPRTTSGQRSLDAFLYSGGQMSDLGTLGGTNSAAFGINDAGKVVGYLGYSAATLAAHAFLYSGGQMSDLGTLGGRFSQRRRHQRRRQGGRVFDC